VLFRSEVGKKKTELLQIAKEAGFA
jgi:hypothetical protein